MDQITLHEAQTGQIINHTVRFAELIAVAMTNHARARQGNRCAVMLEGGRVIHVTECGTEINRAWEKWLKNETLETRNDLVQQVLL